jgi:hypothetical protein
MNAPATFPDSKPDEIRTFLGDVPPAEYAARSKLRSYRNAASAMIARTDCDTARFLAWQVIEWTTPDLYSPCPVEWLDQLNLLSKRLMLTALQAEEMQHTLREAHNG